MLSVKYKLSVKSQIKHSSRRIRIINNVLIYIKKRTMKKNKSQSKTITYLDFLVFLLSYRHRIKGYLSG